MLEESNKTPLSVIKFTRQFNRQLICECRSSFHQMIARALTTNEGERMLKKWCGFGEPCAFLKNYLDGFVIKVLNSFLWKIFTWYISYVCIKFSNEPGDRFWAVYDLMFNTWTTVVLFWWGNVSETTMKNKQLRKVLFPEHVFVMPSCGSFHRITDWSDF